jgi:hypothetical protein
LVDHQASGFRLQASGYRLQASGFRLQAAGFKGGLIFIRDITGGIEIA